MRNRVVLPMAVLMMLSVAGLSFAQPTTAERPRDRKVAEVAKTEIPKEARLHRLAGEVVAVDQAYGQRAAEGCHLQRDGESGRLVRQSPTQRSG
jgi:hypothetical protein